MPTSGKFGRLPIKPVGERFAIDWAHAYAVSPITPPSYPVDVSGGLSDWGMFGNDTKGDCGVAARYHLSMSTAVAAGDPVPSFTDQQVLDEYATYDNGQDIGVNLADYLLWCYKKGLIKAFAPVDFSSKEAVDWAMEVGYGVYVGVNLTDADENDFNNSLQWGSNGEPVPDPQLGHCIVKIKAAGSGGADAYVTWGAVQKATEAWSAVCTEEAWLVVTTEEQLAKFTPQLLADINALHGTGGNPVPPNPVPNPPTPVPSPPNPSPSPVPGDHTFLHWVSMELRRISEAIQDVISK